MLLHTEAEIQSFTYDKFPNPNAWLMLQLILIPFHFTCAEDLSLFKNVKIKILKD